ncbi:MAG: TatD family hydrolase [Bacteroidota bacterium]|nr:TatD family hydrolase [Bacteroidota bacterium]
MIEKKLIDIHIHNGNDTTNIIAIKNYFIDQAISLQPDDRISVGLHPWHIDETMSQCWIDQLYNLAKLPQVLAIGETGLDLRKGPSLDIQTEIFIKHIEIAEAHNLPLIIHCVKAFPNLIELKKRLKPHSPWIIHGYTGNAATTVQLIRHNFFFSFGKRLLLPQSNLSETLKMIPKEFIFFETDDSGLSVEVIYQRAAEIFHCSEVELIDLIFRNYQKIFEHSAKK